MFSKALVSLVFLAACEGVLGRARWLERDDRPVFLYPRRFGQEQPAVIGKLGSACAGQVCGVLAGEAITPLLAAQPECSQQDHADKIIDASRQFDAATQANMIALAIEYRQAEKNTPPDFTTNPPAARNSVFCQKAPKNPELNGLVQAQDPANDPELFFDPALKATVRRGTQANTAPFGGAAAAPPAAQPAPPAEALPIEGENGDECPADATITVTVTGAAPTATDAPAAEPTAPPAAAPGNTDFGSCTVPEIEFGTGFDNRRESSFRPKDPQSFSQGSAQNINIITRAMCDALTNTCRANQAAKDLCAEAAAAAAAAAPAKTGIQADAFNAIFGINTNFAAVTAFDDQGRVVPGTGSGDAGNAPPPTAEAPEAPAATPPAQDASDSSIGNFGSCTVPQITFAQGLDGRKETAFEPTDKASFDHGSAQNIDIITQFICDTLVNKCAADQTARNTCAGARAAASAAAKNTGAQADAFNAAFNVQTNFNNISPIDNQGRIVGGAPAAAPVQNTGGNNGDNAGNTGNDGAGAVGGNIQNFAEALGGVTAPVVTAVGDGRFQVTGNAAFNNRRNAIVRSCDVQNNQCANAANSSGGRSNFNVADCNAQQARCIANAGN